MNTTLLTYASIAVVGIIEWIKTLDAKDTFKKFYKFLPAVVSIPTAVIITIQGEDPWYVGLLYWGVILAFSVLGYTTIIKLIKSKIKL